SDTRVSLMASWERGWSTLFDTLAGLTDSDLGRTVTIRGEPHTARQALLRGSSHVAYHTGQILYLVRWLRPDSAWLTVPPGQSRSVPGVYRRAVPPSPFAAGGGPSPQPPPPPPAGVGAPRPPPPPAGAAPAQRA